MWSSVRRHCLRHSENPVDVVAVHIRDILRGYRPVARYRKSDLAKPINNHPHAVKTILVLGHIMEVSRHMLPYPLWDLQRMK